MTIRVRLTLLTSLLVLLAVVIMGVHSAIRERRLVLRESIAAKGRALVTTLAEPCLEALSSPDVPDHGRLDRYLAGLTDQPELDVVYAMVLDDQSQIVSHTDPERYGQRSNDAFVLAAQGASKLSVRERTDPILGDLIEFAQPLGIGNLRWGTLVVGLSAGRLQAQLRAAYFYSITYALLIIGPLALLLNLIFSRTIVRPVLALARGVAQVSQGDLSARVSVPHRAWQRDELGELVGGFNAMVDGLRERERLKGELEVARRLEEAHAQLERAHRELATAHADLTQVHEALKTAQGQLIRAEKLAALGELVAGVAHEINNPVNFLVQAIELMAEELRGLETDARTGQGWDEDRFQALTHLLQIMNDGAERTASIVRKLREFSRREGTAFEPVDLAEVIEGSLELLHFELKHRIRVERFYAPVGKVAGDGAQLGQLFLNLLSNASQAIPGEGVIQIRVAQVEKEVWVSVEDSGPGIPTELLPRVFDPFFTTKEVGKGTGLGLSLSWRIAQRHGGDIVVESPAGRGAIFTVRLPVGGETTTGDPRGSAVKAPLEGPATQGSVTQGSATQGPATQG